jgi:purine-binding chemotaxis protein CheW
MSVTFKSLVIFRVHSLVCALDCLEVQEIIKESKGLTSVKRTNHYIDGVINLRGEIVSVLNLMSFFDMVYERNPDESIIVVKDSGECIGLKVSSVIDVIEIAKNKIESSPAVPKGLKSQYLKGVFELDGELISLLSVAGLSEMEEKVS